MRFEARFKELFAVALFFVVLLSLDLGFSGLPATAAEVVVLPESRHALIETYGLFINEQSMLIYRDAGRAWGEIGGTLALLGVEDWLFKPQLVADASANASYRLDSQAGLLTETIDARLGLSFELELDSESRLSVGWEHQSGHISDNISDPSLIGPNLGNEILMIRYARDVLPELRLGGTLKPYFTSQPTMKTFGADQFGDWFFLGQPVDRHTFKPYVSMGLEEYGVNAVDLSFHAQLGLMAGNRWSPGLNSAIRLVLGYYNGVDPRLKYAQFFADKAQFVYAGAMFDL